MFLRDRGFFFCFLVFVLEEELGGYADYDLVWLPTWCARHTYVGRTATHCLLLQIVRIVDVSMRKCDDNNMALYLFLYPILTK